jgi:hypothetical protein
MNRSNLCLTGIVVRVFLGAVLGVSWSLSGARIDMALAAEPSAASLPVFQQLEEATARISRLEARPYEKLWDDCGYTRTRSTPGTRSGVTSCTTPGTGTARFGG